MNTEQLRDDFEWWASDEGEYPQAVERVGECYKLAQIQSYWIAWQASRAVPAVQQSDATRLVEALMACANANSAAEVGLIVDDALAAHRKGGG